MRVRNILNLFVALAGMLLMGPAASVWGEPPRAANVGQDEQAVTPQAEIALPALKTILESLNDLRQRISEKEEQLHQLTTEDQKARVLKDLADLHSRMTSLTRDFDRIVSGVNVDAYPARPQERFDLREEIQDILEPVFKGLKSLTAQPREIERLRGEVAHFENQVAVARNAAQNVQKISAETTEQEQGLQERLLDVEKGWRQREQEARGQLAAAQYRLTEELKKKKPFLVSFHGLMQSFFKSRGRNFLLAVAALGVVVVLCRLGYRLLHRFSPVLNAPERTFAVRLLDLLYSIATVTLATGAFLLALYAVGDWVLLSIAFLFLLGILWTARETLPKSWTQAKFLLNLGTVREGERLVYQGIPWKVQILNFSIQLINPHLKGGVLRVPLKAVMDLASRPCEPEEPWFPCLAKDWVLLADGTLGRVSVQTPELVELALPGGGRRTYPTAEFLKQNPNNISAGFRLNLPFHLDPRHQQEALGEIPQKLQEALERELEKETFAKDLLAVRVEYKATRTDSLEFAILVDFGGKAARHYDRLTRMLPTIALATCIEQGWVIPFPQITFYPGATSEEDQTSAATTKGRRRWSFWR